MFVIQDTMLTIRETEALKAFQKQGALSSANDYDGYGRTGEIASLTEAGLIHYVNVEHESAYIRYELTKKGKEVLSEIPSANDEHLSKSIDDLENGRIHKLDLEKLIVEKEVEESPESREKRRKIAIQKEIDRLDQEAALRAQKEKESLEVAQKQTKKKKDV